MISSADFEIEESFYKQGYVNVCGVDEAGRGPLCGPVYAAAVILPRGFENCGINDSKKLSEEKRERLFPIICENAVAFGIGFATPQEIDEINILNAAMLAMNRAVENMKIEPDLLLIDGNCSKGIRYPSACIVKGDSKSISIAAASILAKVSRDRVMVALDRQYPAYNLAKHKGYPTAEHRALLKVFGPNEIYRKTFLKKILG